MRRFGLLIALLTSTAPMVWLAPPLRAQRGAGAGAAQGRQGGALRGGGLAGKAPNLVASVWTAPSTVARTMLRHEWVDVPLGASRLHTWIEYPEGAAPAPVVIVLQDEPGLDDWTRAAADQLAIDGFIAVAPDLFSRFGPNGGNYDSFRSPDEAIRAGKARLTADEGMRRALALAAFAEKMPRGNGAIGSIGFGSGGTLSFRLAADAPSIGAAAVFYGASPEEAVLRRIRAPVIGFYGEDDEPVIATVAPAAASMAQRGKTYDVHRYPGATHFFLRNQVEGMNGAATQDAWPRATAFLKQHLQTAARSR